MRNEITIPGLSQHNDASSVLERIETQLSAAPIVLYMKGTPDFPQCGFSARVVGALRSLGAEFVHHNVYEDLEVREALKSYSNWPTFPQLYINEEFVGGCDIVMEMHQTGELEQLLMGAGEARRSPDRSESTADPNR